MPPAALRAVLYDWDGTLVNSAEATLRCYRRMFARYGIRFEAEDFERTYSPDWYKTYRAVGLPEERWGEVDGLFVEEYAREPSRLLPGAAEALRRLREQGLAQGLVTSGSRARVARELQALELLPYFAAVVCSEDALRKKPDPQPLRQALGVLGVAPEAAAYVGDSPEDVEMARAAGVFSVGVPGGFPNRAALVAAGPDLLAPTLASAVGSLLGGAGAPC